MLVVQLISNQFVRKARLNSWLCRHFSPTDQIFIMEQLTLDTRLLGLLEHEISSIYR